MHTHDTLYTFYSMSYTHMSSGTSVMSVNTVYVTFGATCGMDLVASRRAPRTRARVINCLQPYDVQTAFRYS